MTTATYNGYSNRETWNVQLWLANDEGLYHTIREAWEDICRNYDPEEDDDWAEEAERELATYLENLVCDEMYPLDCGLYADLLSSALAKVDWDEIAHVWACED